MRSVAVDPLESLPQNGSCYVTRLPGSPSGQRNISVSFFKGQLQLPLKTLQEELTEFKCISWSVAFPATQLPPE